MNILVFKLGQRSFGLELGYVCEVLRLGQVTPVPFAPPTLLGAMHVRGQVLPVVDLAPLLGEGASPPSIGATCLRSQVESDHLLLHVGRVEEVIDVDDTDESAPQSARPGLVERVQPTARGPLPLLSPEAVLAKLSEQLQEALAWLHPDPEQRAAPRGGA
ncbi:MAG: hypothetical protein CSA24_02010 [Deltaproteobacteria bacterium]|nr:MAG: hypothetical protein CSB49_03305 [Pseudomonadota bacterium]PIE65774.1 MAG: hypothetical protein CSA24_02010 [Deltaproteobacteria bacterium]